MGRKWQPGEGPGEPPLSPQGGAGAGAGVQEQRRRTARPLSREEAAVQDTARPLSREEAAEKKPPSSGLEKACMPQLWLYTMDAALVALACSELLRVVPLLVGCRMFLEVELRQDSVGPMPRDLLVAL